MDYYKDYSNRARRLEVDTFLADRFNPNVLYYLHWSVKFPMADSLRLIQVIRNAPAEFSDYSFVIAPAYKSFEGFLYHLGIHLELYKLEELESTQNVGARYEENQVQGKLEKILYGVSDLSKRILDPSKPADKEKLKNIVGRISELSKHLKIYRHSPAHYQGRKVVPNLTQAEQHIHSIISNMDDLVMILIESKVLGDAHNRGDVKYSNWP